jgi:ferritin-like metal-binding protein YciE
MATQSLKDLYVDELRDMFDAEQQVLRELPAMVEAASAPSLKRALQDHLEQTRIQIERLELILQQLGQPARGKHCAGMEGLLREGREHLSEHGPGEVRDAAIIGSAQRVEHYEIAAYGTARTFARQLGAWDQADLLQQRGGRSGPSADRHRGERHQRSRAAARGTAVR